MNNPRLWFYDLGIHIFPVDKRKVPIVPQGTSQFDYRCAREQAARFDDYGVPLGLFAVADSDSVEAEIWVRANLPSTPFTVTTARGLHRYYRIVGTPPKFLHRAGLTIEFRNHGQYVVGPDAVHQTGVVLVPFKCGTPPHKNVPAPLGHGDGLCREVLDRKDGFFV